MIFRCMANLQFSGWRNPAVSTPFTASSLWVLPVALAAHVPIVPCWACPGPTAPASGPIPGPLRGYMPLALFSFSRSWRLFLMSVSRAPKWCLAHRKLWAVDWFNQLIGECKTPWHKLHTLEVIGKNRHPASAKLQFSFFQVTDTFQHVRLNSLFLIQ